VIVSKPEDIILENKIMHQKQSYTFLSVVHDDDMRLRSMMHDRRLDTKVDEESRTL